MNIASLAILLIVALSAVAALRVVLRKGTSCGESCGKGCGGCALKDACKQKKE